MSNFDLNNINLIYNFVIFEKTFIRQFPIPQMFNIRLVFYADLGNPPLSIAS